MTHKKLQTKIENFIENTVMPAFSKIGEDLYQDGIKTKFTTKPWKNEIKNNAFFHLFDVNLSQGGNDFCTISSYLSIQDENKIKFGSSVKKTYGSDTISELTIENIEGINPHSLAEDILKKV